MFNSYASGGRATASANNYLKIHAVNGTLVKNHPQSIFVHAKADNTIFDPTNPLFLCEIVPTDKFFVGTSEDDESTGG